jgi:hypothetical protein
MKRREFYIVGILLVLISIPFAKVVRVRYFGQALDEAYFLESIDTTFNTGKPQTMLTASVVEAIKTVMVQPASEVCAADLAQSRREPVSIYERHSFPILYLLALLRIVMSSLSILLVCEVIAFPCLLAAVYVISRHFGSPPWLASLLVALTAAHPAWSYAAFGQFYPDKLFPVLGLIYLALLYDYLTEKRSRLWTLLLFGSLAASTSERSTIMLVAATSGLLVWFTIRRGLRRSNIYILMFTIALSIYAFVYMHFVQINSDYANFSSAAMNAVHSGFSEMPPASRKFLAINTGMLTPFSFAGGISTFIAGGSLMPNLLGSVGGAEKLGWTTHYHSAYFPFLIFANIVGAGTFYRRSKAAAGICAVVSVAVASVFLLLNPLTPTPLLDVSPDNLHRTAIGQIIEFQFGSRRSTELIQAAADLQDIVKGIPAGSDVSTVEPLMPALYQHGVHVIYFYPLGIGRAKYVVIPYAVQPTGKLVFKGNGSYLGQEFAEDIDRCLTLRLDSTYTVARLVKQSPAGGLAILELK